MTSLIIGPDYKKMFHSMCALFTEYDKEMWMFLQYDILNPINEEAKNIWWRILYCYPGKFQLIVEFVQYKIKLSCDWLHMNGNVLTETHYVTTVLL